MKKRITILLAALISFVGISQEIASINWLTTSQFEKALKKKKHNCFIFIEDNSFEQEEHITKEQMEEFKKNMFGFLEDAELVKYLNENFICYKFNPTSESLKFQKKEYKKIEEAGRISHEFVAFLTERKTRQSTIVLKDKNFQLFEYKNAPSKTEDMKVLLEAEKKKANYIKEKLGEENRYLEESRYTLRRLEEKLKREQAKKEKKNKSVFQGRQNAKKLLKTLTYFTSGFYQKTDLENYNNIKTN